MPTAQVIDPSAALAEEAARTELIESIRQSVRAVREANMPLIEHMQEQDASVIGAASDASPASSVTSTEYIQDAIAAAPAVPYSDIAIWGYVAAAVLIVAFVALAIGKTAGAASLRERISSFASSILWGAFFSASLIGLAYLGDQGMITGSVAFCVAAIASLFAGGMITFATRARGALSAARQRALASILRVDGANRSFNEAGEGSFDGTNASDQEKTDEYAASEADEGGLIGDDVIDDDDDDDATEDGDDGKSADPSDEGYMSVLDDDDAEEDDEDGSDASDEDGDETSKDELDVGSMEDEGEEPESGLIEDGADDEGHEGTSDSGEPQDASDEPEGDNSAPIRTVSDAKAQISHIWEGAASHVRVLVQRDSKHIPETPDTERSEERRQQKDSPQSSSSLRGAASSAAAKASWFLSRSAIAKIVLSLLIAAGMVFASAGISVMMLELPANARGVFRISDPFLYCEYLVLLGTTTGAWLIFQRKGASLLVVPVLCLAYGIAEFFVESFKKAAIMPPDLAAATTGIAVAGNYTYEVTTAMFACVCVLAIFATVCSLVEDPLHPIFDRLARGERVIPRAGDAQAGVPDIRAMERERNVPAVFSPLQSARRHKASFKRKVAGAIANIIVSVACIIAGVNVIASTWQGAYETQWEEDAHLELDTYLTADSFHEYGVIPSFLNALQLQDLKEPSGYSVEEAEKLQAMFAQTYDELVGQSPARIAAEEQFDAIQPNVVVIMNESFSDLSTLNGLNAGYEGPAFFKTSQAYARGKLSVSVKGGGTCNTEFEFLTETPMSYVGANINPYTMYDMTDANSVVRGFADLGYDTTAMHPEVATNWKRSSVYPALGFDEFLDQDAFPADALRHRTMIADIETYKVVLDILANNDEPQFIWDLTMANHGGYDTGLLEPDEMLRYPFDRWVDSWAAGYTNEYVSTIALSDEEVALFMAGLAELAEPTVVIFFGDHQPGLSDWYADTIYWDHDELERVEMTYQSDYAIWANYEIAGWDGICYEQPMNAGQLMSYAKSLMGAPMTGYEKAQYASRFWSPSSNAFGWLDELGVWHPISEIKTTNATYEKAMAILADVQATHMIAPMDPYDPLSVEAKEEQDRAILGAMSWVSYLNFQERVVQ